MLERIAVVSMLKKHGSTFMDHKTGRQYRRIYAGLCWPSVKPGAVVVLGENLESDRHNQPDDRSIYVLYSYEIAGATELLTRCQALQRSMRVNEFFGDPTNYAMMALMRDRADLNLSRAPFFDEPKAIQNYLVLIRDKSIVENKVLHFEDCQMLAAKLQSLNSENEISKQASPAIIALGYALAALIYHKFREPIDPSAVPVWEPLDPGVGY